MPSAMQHRLFEILKQAGQQPVEYGDPGGSTILILPHGGRVLGLFPPGSDENFYWTHPALESAEAASQLYAGSQWHNSGGERTWLAPEVDFFFPDFPWHLIQMPPGGELLVPTYRKTEPRIIFGPVPAAELCVGDRLFRWRMCPRGERKISLRAVGVCGRIGYCRPRGDARWDLVVRNILVNPSGQYVDAPWDDLADEGYAVQACGIDSDLGHFNELEYHVPVVDSVGPSAACEETSQVWAYRGTAEQIQSVLHCLLTPDPLVRS